MKDLKPELHGQFEAECFRSWEGKVCKALARERRAQMKRNGEVEMKAFKPHDLHLLSKGGTAPVLRTRTCGWI